MSASNTNIFTVLREQVSLAEAASKYTDLVRTGDSFKGRCPHPDHEDRNPSFHAYLDGRFRCYGCGWHGDVTDLLRVTENISSNYEAALAAARRFGIQLPAVSDAALEMEKERHERGEEHLDRALRAHQTLDKHPEIASYWEGRGFDTDAQSRYLLGASEDGAATIPLWNRGEVHGIVRRNLVAEPKYRLPAKEDLLDGYRPLFIPGRTGECLLLVEGFVDALALSVLGYAAIAVGGTGMSAEQSAELERIIAHHGATVFILPDDDESGAKAARQWTEDLYPNARLCTSNYAATDHNTTD